LIASDVSSPTYTEFAKATCGTIRLKLLKIGALARISVRRIKIAMASGCPAAQMSYLPHPLF
jgi:Transposase DDE domain group 1